MNLMIQSSKTYSNRTASRDLKVSLFKGSENLLNHAIAMQ